MPQVNLGFKKELDVIAKEREITELSIRCHGKYMGGVDDGKVIQLVLYFKNNNDKADFMVKVKLVYNDVWFND